MTTRLFVLVARRYLAYAAPFVASATVLTGLAIATQARTVDPAQPLAGAVLAGSAAGSGLAIGAACLVGAAAMGRSLARGAGWSALVGSGARGRDVLRAALLPIVLTASLHALAENVLAPRARAWAHARATSLEGAVRPATGETLRIGDVAVASDRAPQGPGGVPPVHLAWGSVPASSWTGHAAELTRRDGVLRAREVRLESGFGVRLRAAELSARPPAPSRESPIAARPTGALLASGEPYARWNGVKRAALPACGAVLAAGLLAVGVRAPRMPVLLPVALALAATWSVVRVLDGYVRSGALGVGGAAVGLVGASALVSLAAWWRWSDA